MTEVISIPKPNMTLADGTEAYASPDGTIVATPNATLADGRVAYVDLAGESHVNGIISSGTSAYVQVSPKEMQQRKKLIVPSGKRSFYPGPGFRDGIGAPRWSPIQETMPGEVRPRH